MMNGNHRAYHHDHPELVVSQLDGITLGRSYVEERFKVRSLRRLDLKQLEGMRDLGLLGYGQEFSVCQLDAEGKAVPVTGTASTEPTGHHTVECSEVDPSGNVVRCPSTNWFTGQPDKPRKLAYFDYLVIRRIDSGD